VIRSVALPRIGTFDAWRTAVRDLVRAEVPPGEVQWSRGEADPTLFAAPSPIDASAPAPRVPRRFVELARLCAHHSDPERFALLHAALSRLQAERGLLDVVTDPLVARLHRMAKAVRRDVHKTHAFVRFREIPASDGPATSDSRTRRRFGAWFEPDHPTLEIAAPHFAARFTDMDWTIATPELSAIFEKGALRLTEDGPREPPPEDATQALWGTYYANIFNPARLKIDAMRAEMPRKYWRNLPEARLIPDLIATAGARVEEMRRRQPTVPPAYAAAARAMAQPREEGMDLFGHDSIAALHDEARGCTRCPLYEPATQIVFGEGPPTADLMVVGEQPGDKEDLAGRPFVGPAGQLWDEIAERAGLDRGRVYVTNAVKHFKFQPRGKRRIHQRPAAGEVNACRWWLDQERELVRPRLILAMGATALHALTGDGKGILKRRGSVERARGGAEEPVFVTVHPSFLLRLPDPDTRAKEERAFEADIRQAMEVLEREAA
jgi:DNA polymerase